MSELFELSLPAGICRPSLYSCNSVSKACISCNVTYQLNIVSQALQKIMFRASVDFQTRRSIQQRLRMKSVLHFDNEQEDKSCASCIEIGGTDARKGSEIIDYQGENLKMHIRRDILIKVQMCPGTGGVPHPREGR